MDDTEKTMWDMVEEYNSFFGVDNWFPTIPLCSDCSCEDVIEMIKHCLREGKDVVELGYYVEGVIY